MKKSPDLENLKIYRLCNLIEKLCLSIDNLHSDLRPELKKTETLRRKKDEENNVRSSIRLSTKKISNYLKNNYENFDLVFGMYHDQVLTPIKTLFEFDAINITIGLPFLRVSPDHGPNESMIGKGKSNPLSLIKSII